MHDTCDVFIFKKRLDINALMAFISKKLSSEVIIGKVTACLPTSYF